MSNTSQQPKDMEQLKKEAREEIEKARESSHFDRGYGKSTFGDENLYSLTDQYIDQAHRSGRESMRDECVEKVKKEAATYKKVYLSADFGRALASALKKIKP